MKDMIADLRRLIHEADEAVTDDPAVVTTNEEELDEVTKFYPMAHKNSLGPGPKGRKFGGGDTATMWHCKCPGGNCTCNRKSAATGKMLKKTWTVNKERKARYDKMYKDWRAKQERKGKYAKTDQNVRDAKPPVSPHVGSSN